MNMLKKYKVLIATLIFGTIFTIFVLYLVSKGYIFNIRKGLDIHVQHSFYMDYLAKNLYYSGDFLPNLNMNFGMMQNFATIYYYGVFNIFVRMYALFPMLNPYEYQFAVNILTYMLVFYFSCKLLKITKFNFIHVLLGAVLITLSPALTWFLSNHTVFGQPYLFYILLLIGLTKIVDDGKILLFTIANILIVTSNLFQLQVAGLFGLVFFIFYVLFKENNKEQIKKSLVKVFISYFFALGICAVIILPQVYLFKSGSRYTLNEYTLDNFINFRSLEDVTRLYFMFGFGYLSAFFVTGFLFTKKKFVIIPSLIMLFLFISYDINFIFNLFALENKLYLYSTPLLVILALHTVKIIKSFELKYKVLILVASILLFIMAILPNTYGKDFYFSYWYYSNIGSDHVSDSTFITMNVTIAIICVLLLFNIKSIYKYAVFTIAILLYTVTSLSFNTIVSKTSDVNVYASNYKIKMDKSKTLSMYRDNDPAVLKAQSFSINRNVVYTYTSFINQYYYKYFHEIIDIPVSVGGIAFNSFRTSTIVDKVLSIEGENTTRPIIYGSYSSISHDKWMEVDRPFRILASLEAPAISHVSNSNMKDISIVSKLELVGEYDQFNFPSGETTILPEFNKKNGEYIIVGDVESTRRAVLYANGIRNEKSVSTLRYYNHNDVFTYYIPASGNGLKFTTVYGDVTLTNMKIYYIDYETIEELENKYVQPKNVKVDYNDSFSFELEMEEDGLLATTIPYDEGYSIYVDGKKVNVELIDGSFIGAELSSGNHKIVIKYVTPWKNIGLVVSLIFVIAFIVFLHINKIKNK